MSALPALFVVALSGALVAGCGDDSPGTGSAVAGPRFTDVTTELDLDVHLDRAAGGSYFMPDIMGPGCALFDYDGDGDLDIYLVNGFRAADGRAVTPEGANRLFRQEPDGRFVDVTAAAGVGHTGYGMGVAVGDVDNDGDPDLYVTNVGPDALFRNEGDGTFTDVTTESGIDNPAWSTSAGFFDEDGDGFLDLYVVNYLDLDPGHRATDDEGRPEYPGPFAFDGVPDVFYRNRGDGTFRDASAETGVSRAAGKGLGVALVDLTGDGRLDVYVANDGVPNILWVTDGAGGFVDRAPDMGLARNRWGVAEASMGIAYGSLCGTDDTELFLTHLDDETNTFYQRAGPEVYEDRTARRGLISGSLGATGFGTAAVDVDLDGDLDLIVLNGRVLRAPSSARATTEDHWTPYAETNELLLNTGGGRFESAGASGGDLSGDRTVSRGLAVGDLDGDGDLDAVVTSADGRLTVYRCSTPAGAGWLLVDAIDPGLDGQGPGAPALGAVVDVTVGPRRLRRHVRAAHSYLSSSDHRAHFGLGAARWVDRITVHWPHGETEVFDGCPANRVVRVWRGSGRTGGDGAE